MGVSRYDVYLFIHILAVVAWVGGGFALVLMGMWATAARDDDATQFVVGAAAKLAKRVFIPASLVVLTMGILMLADGPWSFGSLWIVLGLAGFLTTAVTGGAVLGPMSERITAMIDADGFTEEARTASQRLLALARLDYVVLFLVIFDMAVKPTGDDAGPLVFMALVLVVGWGLILTRARALGASARLGVHDDVGDPGRA
jgi:uncharacterized membrane protein